MIRFRDFFVKYWYIAPALVLCWLLFSKRRGSLTTSMTPPIVGGGVLEVDLTLCQNIAERMYNAMNQVGTDEKSIDACFDEIKFKNCMPGVFRSFGTRKYCLFDSAFLIGPKLDLWGWLAAEESGDRLKRWYDLAKQQNFIA